jgi:hypothetical protein
MYLYSRSLRLVAGDFRQQMDWAVRVTEKVNQISQTPFRLWTVMMSPGVGTLGWGATFESLAELEATGDKMTADNGYLDLVAEAARFVDAATITDNVVEVIHTEGNIDTAHTQYILVATAIALPGKAAEAAELGTRIAQRGSAVTGCPAIFGHSLTGAMGTFQLSTFYETAEEYERASAQLSTDPEFYELSERQTAAVVQGRVTLTLVRKVI